MSLLLLHVLLL